MIGKAIWRCRCDGGGILWERALREQSTPKDCAAEAQPSGWSTQKEDDGRIQGRTCSSKDVSVPREERREKVQLTEAGSSPGGERLGRPRPILAR